MFMAYSCKNEPYYVKAQLCGFYL